MIFFLYFFLFFDIEILRLRFNIFPIFFIDEHRSFWIESYISNHNTSYLQVPYPLRYTILNHYINTLHKIETNSSTRISESGMDLGNGLGCRLADGRRIWEAEAESIDWERNPFRNRKAERERGLRWIFREREGLDLWAAARMVRVPNFCLLYWRSWATIL